TGASGAAFDELAESARRVATELPAADGDIKAIGSTLADLNTRLGVSGPELETLTKQFTALDTLGFEADINAASQALNGFGIEAKDMPAAMDDLFRVSQATGVSMDDLANSVTKGGPQLREFGFSLQDAAALTGLLDKAGLDAN
ncbi:phage tail tape measure protein, partial [Escherichia coli]|nr:phage tail tape measure protein [Escherichia coli]